MYIEIAIRETCSLKDQLFHRIQNKSLNDKVPFVFNPIIQIYQKCRFEGKQDRHSYRVTTNRTG